MTRFSNRKEKLLALQAAVNGNATALQRYQRLKQDVWCMVVCDNGEPELLDLVETRLPNEQGQKRMTYADFLTNPVGYGSFCITVD